MADHVKITRLNNSLGIRIPEEIMNELSLRLGDEVELLVSEESLVIQLPKKKERDELSYYDEQLLTDRLLSYR